MRFKLNDVKCPKCGEVLTDLDVMRIVEAGFPEYPVRAVYYMENQCPERMSLTEARRDAVGLWKKMSKQQGFEKEIPVIWQPGDRCGHVIKSGNKWIWCDYFTDVEWVFDPKTGELLERDW